MNEKEQISRILDFVYNHPRVPERLRGEFERWLATHDGEPVVGEVLRGLWDGQETDTLTEEQFADGLNRLHAAIAPRGAAKRRPRRYAGVAVTLSVLFQRLLS